MFIKEFRTNPHSIKKHTPDGYNGHEMKLKLIRPFLLPPVLMLLLAACGTSATPVPAEPAPTATPDIEATVEAKAKAVLTAVPTPTATPTPTPVPTTTLVPSPTPTATRTPTPLPTTIGSNGIGSRTTVSTPVATAITSAPVEPKALCSLDQEAARITCHSSEVSEGTQSQLTWESNISGRGTGASYEISIDEWVSGVVVTLELCQGSDCENVEVYVDTSSFTPGKSKGESADAMPTTISSNDIGSAAAVPTPVTTAITEASVEPCGTPYETEIVPGPSGPQGGDHDSIFRALTVHPLNPDFVILGTERNGIVSSSDGGQTWTRHRAGLRVMNENWYPEVWDVDISQSDPSLVIAAILDSPGSPTGNPPGVYKSNDGGATWTQMNCGLTTSRVNSVRFDPANPNVAIAGLEGGIPSGTYFDAATSSTKQYTTYYGGGIFRTEDGGDNWERIELGPNDETNGFWIMRMVSTEPMTIITFGRHSTYGKNGQDLTLNIGFVRSTDQGRTWEFFADELRNRYIRNFDVSRDGQTIYVDERDTFFGWISRDGGYTWSQSPIIQVNGPIAVSPADSNMVIFGSHNDLRRSTDGLQNFNVVLRDVTIRDIVFSPSDPTVVYAAADGYLVYRSDDSGLTWRLVVNVRDEVLNVQP